MMFAVFCDISNIFVMRCGHKSKHEAYVQELVRYSIAQQLELRGAKGISIVADKAHVSQDPCSRSAQVRGGARPSS